MSRGRRKKSLSCPIYKFFSVTYTDGVADEDLFADQTERKRKGAISPKFVGTPTRVGYTFTGWGVACRPGTKGC